MKNKIVLNSYSDAQHGWIRITISQLLFLNLQDKITPYSYMNASKKHRLYIYLEEDCDATTLINRLKELNITYRIKSNYCDRQSRIRSYAGYSKDSIKYYT